MMPEEISLEIATALQAELQRIRGPEQSKLFWLYPFPGPAETLEFLGTVTTGSGDAGIRAAMERHSGQPLPPLPR